MEDSFTFNSGRYGGWHFKKCCILLNSHTDLDVPVVRIILVTSICNFSTDADCFLLYYDLKK